MSLGTLRVTGASEGAGEAVSFEGEVLVAIIDRAFAPGAPVDFVVARPDGELVLRGKTIGSKRRPDGRFDVRLRLVTLRRSDRARLA